MARDFFEEEIKDYLECNEIKATKKQIKQVIDDLMADDELWDHFNVCMVDTMRKRGIKID